MKKFQDLLSDDSQNQYGLKYTPISNTKRLGNNIIKNDNEKDIQKVEIYVKSSNKKSSKIKVQKLCEIENLKQILQLKTDIAPGNQILYLNGRQISSYFSITLNQSQILHVSNKENIVNQNQIVKVKVQISVPIQISLKNQKDIFQFKGGDTLNKLQQAITQIATICNPQNSFSINFLESGRILDKNKNFNQNMLTTQCSIVCLYSQNSVETKFYNQFSDIFPLKTKNQKNEAKSKANDEQNSSQAIKSQKSFQSFKFRKSPLNSNQFSVQKPKNGIYSRIQRKSQLTPHSSDFMKPAMKKRRTEAVSMQVGTSGFKKKKIFGGNLKDQETHLITKIVVHKSKKQIEKIFSESSLVIDRINEDQQKKSFVSSSSSSQENAKEYIPIRQQKQYRPCPIIPQRKMPTSQKMKINLQLQKLFGLQPKNLSLSNQAQSNEAQNQSKKEQVETKSRLVIKNSNMRSSISAKESMVKALKDRKSNRYAQQKMYEGD